MLKKIFSLFLLFIIFSINTVIAQDNLQPYYIEHLSGYKKTNTTTVKITADKAVILPNNVIQISFNSYFNSKYSKKGDIIDFSLPNGLSTVEGRCLLPCNTKIIGCITCVEKPKIFNRNAKVYILFNEVLLPNGCSIPLIAYPYGKDNALKESGWKAAGKAAAYTVGLFGIGAGLGAWIGTGSHSAGTGALALGMPIGAGVGLIIGVITPGLHFRAKCGRKIYIRLEDCLIIPCSVYQKQN